MADLIPFNKAYLTGNEIENITSSLTTKKLAGDGHFTQQCQNWFRDQLGCDKALLTHSCSSALEMAAILSNLDKGDEVIMPSFTFVSTANAFVLRGATPVFVDIREDTLNIDENLIEEAITSKTKAIVVVHYAGVACEMDTIMGVARKHNLIVIEDAAHGLGSSYKGNPLGSIGDLATFSFHETKNIISGEGGALIINNPEYTHRAQIIWNKGTNRHDFIKGNVDKYTWVDVGSSFLPGEITAAFLLAQLEKSFEINQQRLQLWDRYYQTFAELEVEQSVRRPIIPQDCQHNAHMFYLLLANSNERQSFIDRQKQKGVECVFHYVPLHSSPAGKHFGRTHGELKNTTLLADRIVRLPLWPGMDIDDCLQRVFKHD